MWNAPNKLLLTLCAVLCVAACSSVTFEGGVPISIELSADRTAVPTGTEVNFTYNVKGTYISGILIDFGDGVADTVYTQGAQTAAGVASHSYSEVGSFTVVGVADDSATGTATAEVVITVSGG